MLAKIDTRGLKPNPEIPGNVLGWGVVRSDPWSLAGVYSSKEQAQAEATRVGNDHIVAYGSHKPGTDEFVWHSADQH
ncbi:hypothetical protein Q1Z72_12520 [Pseudomonas qingdaonensis]|uniref:hypothetical protein n=2 Tax=Gammaproteobacteria TaxID=1236 RepID=UPI00265E1F8D|nr:hypothetical protein [Pseudomonas qingdaonensis]WKL69431.1 hypothetical protein Q1Z72_12520 [Pseudomonas qingdaonensis]